MRNFIKRLIDSWKVITGKSVLILSSDIIKENGWLTFHGYVKKENNHIYLDDLVIFKDKK